MELMSYRPFVVFGAVFAAVLGAAMGSFLNCAAWRVTRGESFLRGRSRCPDCGHTLGWTELIPVASWLIQRGRCRACGGRVSPRYPLTELAFAVVSVLCFLRFGPTVLCLRNYVFLCCLFCLTLTDLDDMIIPDGCHIIAAAAWLLALPFPFPGWRDTLLRLLAAVVYAGALLGISLLLERRLGREALGGGDIKLFAVVALYLGFAGTLFALLLSCVLGLLLHVFSGGRGRGEEVTDGAGEPTDGTEKSPGSAGETTNGAGEPTDGTEKSPGSAGETTDGAEELPDGRAFPFGPSIALAAAVMLLYGEPLVGWYLNLF